MVIDDLHRDSPDVGGGDGTLPVLAGADHAPSSISAREARLSSP